MTTINNRLDLYKLSTVVLNPAPLWECLVYLAKVLVLLSNDV